MKKFNYGLIFVTLATAPLFCLANINGDTGWYVGVNIGGTRNKFEGDDTSKIMVPGSLSSVADHAISPSIYGGYQINETFGVVAGYTKLGNFKLHVTMPNGRGIAEDYKVDAWTIAGTISKPLAEGLSVFGKFGAAFTHVKDTYKWSDDATIYSFAKRRTNPLIGVGIKYAIDQHIALRAEYEHFGEVGSAITSSGEGTARARDTRFSVGMSYRF